MDKTGLRTFFNELFYLPEYWETTQPTAVVDGLRIEKRLDRDRYKPDAGARRFDIPIPGKLALGSTPVRVNLKAARVVRSETKVGPVLGNQLT